MSTPRKFPPCGGRFAWWQPAAMLGCLFFGAWVMGNPPRLWIVLPGSGSGGDAVELEVQFPAGEAAPVDIFALPSVDGYTFDPPNMPWLLAVANLDPQGSNILSWLDTAASQDVSRVYAAGYADQDGDNDGLPDAREILLYATDPDETDTDGDGLSDGWEHAYGLNPLDDGSTDPNQGGEGNPDGDVLLNLDEQTLGTSPLISNAVERIDAAGILVETLSVGGWMDTNTIPASAAFPCGGLDAVGWGTGIAYSVVSGLCATGLTSGTASRLMAGDGVNTEIDRLAYRLGVSTVSGVIHCVSWIEVFVPENDSAPAGQVERSCTAYFVGNGSALYIGTPHPLDPPGAVYPPLAGSAMSSDFVVEPPGSNGWVHIALPEAGLTAFRPLIEGPAYGNPVQRSAVPNVIEELPGAGIRINGDTETPSAENDLIEMELELPVYPPPSGLQFKLNRSASQLQVWSSATGQGPLLTTNSQAAVTFTSQTFSVWAEHTGGGSVFLSLTVETVDTPGVILAEDRVRLYPFTSVVMALGGEGQAPTDPGDVNHGVFRLALDLIAQGYDVHLYDEDLVSASGSGSVYDEIVRAGADRAVSQVALFGYSHGAGSIYHLTERLQDNAVTNLDVVYTAYIDAVRNNSDLDMAQELRRPMASSYHVNYYQVATGGIFTPPDNGLDGGPTIVPPGADFEENLDDLGDVESHYTVDDVPEVLSGIESRLLPRVTP